MSESAESSGSLRPNHQCRSCVSDDSVASIGLKQLYPNNHFNDIVGAMGPESINHPINLLHTIKAHPRSHVLFWLYDLVT